MDRLALKQLEKKLEEAPQDLRLQAQYLQELFVLQKFEQAQKHIQEVLSTLPESVETAYWSGRIYQKLGRPEQALKRYQYVLSINPQDERSLLQMTHLYAKLKNKEAFLIAFYKYKAAQLGRVL